MMASNMPMVGALKETHYAAAQHFCSMNTKLQTLLTALQEESGRRKDHHIGIIADWLSVSRATWW